ncbi:MAG: hypothetical protein PWQ22_729 [Archaeoglobaceae archaeon]|nr:hypothetical protein [Archaeoglobaceae archaeon]
MELVGKFFIRKKKAKEGFEYPYLRLPVDFSQLVGCEAEIYRVEDWFFIRVVGNRVANSENILSEDKTPQPSKRKSNNIKNQKSSYNLLNCSDSRKKWARPDSNRGPPPCEGDVITTRPRAPG